MSGDDPTRVPDARSTSWLRWLLLRVAALLLGLVVVLLVLEVALPLLGVGPTSLMTKRLLRNPNTPELEYECYSSNPHGEFQPPPELAEPGWELVVLSWHGRPPVPVPLDRLSETPYCVKYERSGQKLRDRYYPPRAPSGVTRIIGVGDSFSFGEGVFLDGSLYKQVEVLLGPGYEVVNLGVLGANTAQEIRPLQTTCRGLSARHALLTFVLNDIEAKPELWDRQEYINDLILIRDRAIDAHQEASWYRRMPRAFQYVGAAFDMRDIGQETIQWYQDLYDPAVNSEGLARLERQFERIAALDACSTAVVIYPLLEGLDGTYPFTDAHAQAADRARRAGLPVLDLLPYFEGQNPEALHVHPSDHHPNRAAHAIAARAIADWIEGGMGGGPAADAWERK